MADRFPEDRDPFGLKELQRANDRLVEHKQQNRALNEANQQLTRQLELARLRIERQRRTIDEAIRLLEKVRR